ncbi:MAG TPA: 4-(cytidine 5'-diphospho)-2-C-methyl-D-erythritol kinase [Ktedonobacterales bacterium]
MPRESAFIPAYAKINLTLSALGKRPDGYHDLASIMQTISLHDTLFMRADERDGLADEFRCNVPALAGPDNLVARAIALLRVESGPAIPRITAELHKRVPTQGGLGGGSSDAAAALATLNSLLDLGYSQKRLEDLAGHLGSDTPYLVAGGTARISGRGEHIEPLPDCEPLWIVLVTPNTPVSTAALFQSLTPADYGDATATEALATAIRDGRPLPLDTLANTLEPAVFRLYPAVAGARERLLALGAPLVRMSGSGPSLFVPYRTIIEADELVRRARADGARAWLCHTITREQVLTSRSLR